MRHEFAVEGEMRILRDAGLRYRRLAPMTDAEGRLPRGLSLLVIALLSVFSWVILVAILKALRTVI